MPAPVQKVSLDLETRTRRNLKKCGAYKYAECPDAKVLILAIKKGDWTDPSPYLSWDVRQPVEGNPAIELLRQAIEEGWEIHAFNSQFEWCFLKYVIHRQLGLPVPDIGQMRCTAALCRSAGLPPSLAKCAEFLKLEVQKDKVGTPLIHKFSIPQKDGRFIEWDDDISFTIAGQRVTAGQAFQMFVDYCVTDTKAEVLVAHTMQPFRLQGFPLACWMADARLNDRGVPVDLQALRNGYRLYREHEANLTTEFTALTELGPNQKVKALAWIRERGYKGTSLDVETRERHKDDQELTPDARKALEILAALSFAAVKKIPAMIEWVMDDGFIRGSFLWCGAQKTWRWSSKGPQWQNMKKPKKSFRPMVEEAFGYIRNGIELEILEDFFGNPYETIASLSRYFVRFPNRNIFDVDYRSVEAEILPQLIECQRILDRFNSGEDIYTTTGKALAITLKEKFPDFPYEIDRDQAKTVVLATQFQGGWHAVFTATGSTWKRAWCEVATSVVRKENPEFPKAWKKFQETFVEAMDSPGKWIKVTPYVSYGYSTRPPFPRMHLRLPSGRSIVMPYPEKKPITMVNVETFDPVTEKATGKKWERVAKHIEDPSMLAYKLKVGPAFGSPNTRIKSSFFTWELSYYGHVKDGHYGRVGTYGGSDLQSATQGTGVDLLANGMIETERQGFHPFFAVHDQCLNPEEGDPQDFVNALCTVPDWFRGFNLKAEADVVRSYCKN